MWKDLPKGIKLYLLFYSVSGFSFSALIAAPTLGKVLNISIQELGWLFSFSYIFQAILTYVLGRKFESISVNYGYALARMFFALGSILFVLARNVYGFVAAQLLLGVTDVLYPCQVMYERALFQPQKREQIYSLQFLITEFTKAIVYFFLVFILSKYMKDLRFLSTIFFLTFLTNIFYAFAFLKILPRVQSGSSLHEHHVLATSVNGPFISIMLHQYLAYMAFSFSSFLIISYYLMDRFNLDSSSPFLFEMIFSASVVTSYLWKRKTRNNTVTNLVIGSVLIIVTFALWFVPNVYVFFASHTLMGLGFILWFPAKETVKISLSPKELGRWEGFFQGLNILSRTFVPVVSTQIAGRLGHRWVFLTSAFIFSASLLSSIPAVRWFYKIGNVRT
ncbi:MFS transporter [Pseudothermotoga hypogea DSM 11164 = NBRC 106472]|uniref:MFS transporter n=1 Tax=Pseudothermotoga hypogea DSM 11164 = NBRC 106472 TaxID=1123384 RepID=A0A0X1KTK3_9THEM|nr:MULTISPECIES: MFS transporter [Pseudothermotoga]AJC74571.1 MFS transporter [Pseudothermotoga hypogea DSM 11164 = NBRC 106472]MDI6862666.1 MFS transporter [Pseudothermotoga sp.]